MTGLIGWWPLHENSGNKAYDLSGNGNHGSLNGGITQGVAGKGGLTAYSFGGSDDYISYGSTHSNFSKLTFSFWSRHPSFVEGQHIWHPKNDNDIRVRETSDGIDWLISDNQGTNHVLSAPGLTEEWNFWAGVFDGSEMRLFRNGSLQASTSVSSVGSQSGDDTIGATSGNTSNWEGTLHDFRVYRRALTQKEINTLYDWGNGDYARPPQKNEGGVSRWKLNGNANDSWGSNGGNEKGGLVYSSNSIRGKSGDFDGSDDYIRVDDSSSLRISESLSVSLWVNLDSVQGTLISKGDSNGNNSINYRIRAGFDFGSYDGSWHRVSSDVTPEKNTWYHVVGVFDGSEYRIYVNGRLDNSVQDSTNPPTDSGDWLAIGQNSQGKQYIDGKIDDVRIYDEALSPQEVFELYRWGTRGRDMRKFTVNSRGL